MIKYLGSAFLLSITFWGCIKDDFVEDRVDPKLSIDNKLDTIAINTTHQFTATYLNETGVEEPVSTIWNSSDTSIIGLSIDGLAAAKVKGSATITVSYNDNGTLLKDAIDVVVGDMTVVSSVEKSGTIRTTSSYPLSGDFTIEQNGNDLEIIIADNYIADNSLPGLYVYLTNNNTTTLNAYEIGKVTTFSGAHTYTIPNVGINDYGYLLYFCKPFNVKVGDAKIE